MPAETLYDLELQAQEEALKERRELLKQRAAAQARSIGIYAPGGGVEISQPQGFKSAVTGADIIAPVVRRPALASLTGLIAETRDAADRDQLARDQSAYRQRAQEDAARRLQAMPTARAAVPGIAPSTPLDDEGNPMPIPQEATPAYEPDLRTRLEWAAGLKQNPSLAGVGDALTSDILIKEPERKEARAERQHEKFLTRAEAQRKQQDELEYRRERDQQAAELRRDLADQSSALRRELAAARGSGDGDKAANWVVQEGEDGSRVRINKLTGEEIPLTSKGKGSDTWRKDQQEARDAIERSELAISDAPRVKELLNQASSSGLRADIRKAGSYVAPETFGGEALKADKALEVVADTYLKSVPRFSGPTSDGDRKDYAKAAGQLANTNLPPPVREAALDEVVRLHKKALAQYRQRSTFAGDSQARRADNNANLKEQPMWVGTPEQIERAIATLPPAAQAQARRQYEAQKAGGATAPPLTDQQLIDRYAK